MKSFLNSSFPLPSFHRSLGSARLPIIEIILVVVILIVGSAYVYHYLSNADVDLSVVADNKPSASRSPSSDIDALSFSAESPRTDTEISTSASAASVVDERAPLPLSDPKVLRKYGLPASVPALNSSDGAMLYQLKLLKPASNIIEWSEAEDLARRFAIVIYNLSYGDIAYRYLPIARPAEQFSVLNKDGELTIDPASFSRYDAYAKAFSLLNSDRIVSIYRFFWPVMKRAFAELGEPNKSLHLEVLRTMGLMLETPKLNAPPHLMKVGVTYKYVDSEIENLAAVQKLLLRVGPSNSQLIVNKLIELKKRLQHPPAARAAGKAS
ncbi:MAG: DUF3014 domain-containing protein [Pseudomonadales bacterium]